MFGADENADWILLLFFFLSDSVGSGPHPRYSAGKGACLEEGADHLAQGHCRGFWLELPSQLQEPFSASWWPVGFCTHLPDACVGGKRLQRVRGPRGGTGGPFTATARVLSLEPGQPTGHQATG